MIIAAALTFCAGLLLYATDYGGICANGNAITKFVPS
jgi:hypothetical protein